MCVLCSCPSCQLQPIISGRFLGFCCYKLHITADMGWCVFAMFLVMFLAAGEASTTTTLATFNSAIVPFYPAAEERAWVLIQKVNGFSFFALGCDLEICRYLTVMWTYCVCKRYSLLMSNGRFIELWKKDTHTF